LAAKVQAVLAVWSVFRALEGLQLQEWSLLMRKASRGAARVALSLGGKRTEESGKTRKPSGSGMLSEGLEAGAAGLFSPGLGTT